MSSNGHNYLESVELGNIAVEDLRKSLLDPHDIRARPITAVELGACKAPLVDGQLPPGYVIPYFDLQGNLVQYYRVRLFGTRDDVKYRQPSGSQNHIYFPPGLLTLLNKGATYCIVTEGEKKAACAVKHGFPCIAVSGVYNWRNRIIVFPADTELRTIPGQNKIAAKVPRGDSHNAVVEGTGTMALGLQEFIDFTIGRELRLIIIFDTDKGGIKPEVQQAAAQLGYELRYRGIPFQRVRQLILPSARQADKVGLDDYILQRGDSDLERLVRSCLSKRSAFPRHPNPRHFVSSRLEKNWISRKEAQDISLSVLMELESRGRRLQNASTKEMFYFDEKSHTLMPVQLASPRVMLHETVFGSFLYREFNLSNSDHRIVQWLAAQYNGEPGIEVTDTHKVLAPIKNRQDCIAYQLSDSHYAIISPSVEHPIEICENGTHGLLFEQGQVKPLKPVDVEARFYEWQDKPPENLWGEVLGKMNFCPPTALDPDAPRQSADELRTICSLLFYLSPWLRRWRGLQLPIELAIAEAGSGKSTLYGLRQTIITGEPRLSNITNDIRDWYAGVTARGGMYVMDNVHFAAGHKDYRQRLSDELCRLVTEPSPHVEMRKLYTTNEPIHLPVTCTFAVTAIEQPFYNADLVQRAMIFELQAIERGHDATWDKRQLDLAGGREGWVAHQLNIIHRFLNRAVDKGQWNDDYRAGHRLVNYEQSLLIMADIFGLDGSWIPPALTLSSDTKTSESDWTIEGLGAYIKHLKETKPENFEQTRFSAGDVATWAEQHETFHSNPILTNSRRLGKHMRAHKSVIRHTLGIYENGSYANRAVFSISRHANDTL